MSQTLTFQTILDVAAETPKSVKVYGSIYLPKSQITFVVTGETNREVRNTRGRIIRRDVVQIVDITMPTWLHAKM